MEDQGSDSSFLCSPKKCSELGAGSRYLTSAQTVSLISPGLALHPAWFPDLENRTEEIRQKNKQN